MMNGIWLRCSKVALAVALSLLVVLRPGPAQATSGTALRFQPATVQGRPGETVLLEVWVEGVTGLNWLEFIATYDAGALEPLDADPDREGIQMEMGPLFAGGCAPENEASGGSLRYVAYRAPGDPPFSGDGVAATVRFRVREGTPPGLYPVYFEPTSVHLLDPDGQPIALDELGDGVVLVPSLTQALQGRVTRDGTVHHERTAVTASFYPTMFSAPASWARVCTDAEGDFVLSVPVATSPDYEWAFVALEFPNHLSQCYWERLDEEFVDVGWHTLAGGDVNNDGCINIYDVVRVIADFGQSVPSPCLVPHERCPGIGVASQIAPSSDVNGDCSVNIYDLAMTADNFGLCTDCP